MYGNVTSEARVPLSLSSAVDHPTKVYPVLVGAAGAARVALVATDPFATAVPSFESKVTVKVLGPQTGYKVTAELSV